MSGTSAADLIDYLKDQASGGPWGPVGNTWTRHPQLPLWDRQPTVRVWSNASPQQHRMVADAVDAINDWLPVEHRMVIGSPTSMRTRDHERVPAGEIHVAFRDDELGGRAHLKESGDHTHTHDVPHMVASLVVVDPDFDPSNRHGVLVHELMHAIGLPGHVPESRYPTSLMPDHGSLKDVFHLPRIDGEALMTAYTVYDNGETDADINSASLGPWATTVTSIYGEVHTEAGGIPATGCRSQTDIKYFIYVMEF